MSVIRYPHGDVPMSTSRNATPAERVAYWTTMLAEEEARFDPTRIRAVESLAATRERLAESHRALRSVAVTP